MADIKNFLKRSFNIKIFSLNRIRYEELWEDALAHVRKTYNDNGEAFNSSSPFSQLLSVVLHLGRMIIYYIEDSITGLNIKTAWRPDQIRGLATLTGHNPGRCVASRCAVSIICKTPDEDVKGQIVWIPNRTKIVNTYNGLTYTLLLAADSARMTMAAGNRITANLVQGTIRVQTATGDGQPLQSYNFAERNYSTVDEYYVNVYVNGERWVTTESLLDMGHEQHAVMVRTGQTGGIDVFFGNGANGAIPPLGSTIMCEYLVTGGENGNVPKDVINGGDYWKWDDPGYLQDGTEVDLNNRFRTELLTDIIFGAPYEDILLTQEIAPHMSRSMVLANGVNYRYFLARTGMFSIIDVIQGFNTYEDTEAEARYRSARQAYYETSYEYKQALSRWGQESALTEEVRQRLSKARQAYQKTAMTLRNTRMDDNTVYLFLIPDIANRIGGQSDYFSCDEAVFSLSKDEKYNIMNLIDMSGQSVITVENRILDPLMPRFAVNVQVRIWDRYLLSDIYAAIVTRLSDYFIACTRRDRIPLSDIIAIVDGVEGVDSATVWFDADVNNQRLYGKEGFYGIDEYGDVVLFRTVKDPAGKDIEIRDIYPLFRGGFTSATGMTYSPDQTEEGVSAVNVSLTGTSNKYASKAAQTGRITQK